MTSEGATSDAGSWPESTAYPIHLVRSNHSFVDLTIVKLSSVPLLRCQRPEVELPTPTRNRSSETQSVSYLQWNKVFAAPLGVPLCRQLGVKVAKERRGSSSRQGQTDTTHVSEWIVVVDSVLAAPSSFSNTTWAVIKWSRLTQHKAAGSVYYIRRLEAAFVRGMEMHPVFCYRYQSSIPFRRDYSSSFQTAVQFPRRRGEVTSTPP